MRGKPALLNSGILEADKWSNVWIYPPMLVAPCAVSWTRLCGCWWVELSKFDVEREWRATVATKCATCVELFFFWDFGKKSFSECSVQWWMKFWQGASSLTVLVLCLFGRSGTRKNLKPIFRQTVSKVSEPVSPKNNSGTYWSCPQDVLPGAQTKMCRRDRRCPQKVVNFWKFQPTPTTSESMLHSGRLQKSARTCVKPPYFEVLRIGGEKPPTCH